jgi:predicted adenine nucleotide alpha hydrolase (AANH) superfamily ATPase
MNLRFIAAKELAPDKKDFWKKTREISRQKDFYHQKYCGCEFSQKR